MSSKVSIIVPVYNVDRYLDNCIQSIINQTYHNWELIIVDDGSTDNSPLLCDLYKGDDQIVVIHQKNGGLSNARNTGISKSSGDYLYFVDSDDTIEPNTIEDHVRMMDKYNLDIALSDVYIVSDDGKKRPCSKGRYKENVVLLGEDYLAKRISEQDYFIMVYLGMYKSSFIKSNNFYFCDGIVHEDEEWSPKVLIKAQRIMYSSKCYYNYIQHEQSITKSSNKIKNLICTFYICDVLEKFFLSTPLSNEENRKLYLDMLARLYMSMSCCGEVPAEYYKKFNKIFPQKYAYLERTKKQVALYSLNIHLYRYIRKFIDRINHIR